VKGREEEFPGYRRRAAEERLVVGALTPLAKLPVNPSLRTDIRDLCGAPFLNRIQTGFTDGMQRVATKANTRTRADVARRGTGTLKSSAGKRNTRWWNIHRVLVEHSLDGGN